MAVRKALEPFLNHPSPTHAGLWMDHFVRTCAKGDTDAKRDLVQQVCAVPEPEGYPRFFETWKLALEAAGASVREGKVVSRMVVGLGAESLIETSITLHRSYGVPYIPGSAIKGMAASFARNQLADSQWATKGKAYEMLFGTQDQAGCVIFHDALYKPRSGQGNGPVQGGGPLSPDVITVHHPDYYQNGDKPPADWDSPTPIPFITATGTYVFALEGQALWVKAAWKILEHALTSEGVGGKTSRGYGRIELEPLREPAASTSTGAAAATTRVPREVEDIARMPRGQVASSINQYVQRVQRLASKQERSADESLLLTGMARAIVAKVDECAPNLRTKPWYLEMKNLLS